MLRLKVKVLMIQIENNYLNHDLLLNIEKICSSKDFQWIINDWQNLHLQHFFVEEKGKKVCVFTNEIIGQILKNLKAEYVLESSITLFTKKSEMNEFDCVSDFLKDKDYKTFLLILNSCNGYTRIHGLKQIETKRNMAIFIDKPIPFVNTNTTNENCRGVLAIHYQ